MIDKIKFILIITVFFCHNSHLLAEENKILFIDIEYIYSNSIAGKKINKKIQSDAKKINGELSNLQIEIKEDRSKIIGQKNVLSKEEFTKKSFNLEKKAREYNQIISKKDNELKNYTRNSKIEFYKILTKIVQDYAEKNSIEMVVKKQNILIGKSELDITQDMLNLFNENIKNIKIK